MLAIKLDRDIFLFMKKEPLKINIEFLMQIFVIFLYDINLNDRESLQDILINGSKTKLPLQDTTRKMETPLKY